MVPRPSVLCPIDFSDSSRGALRYTGAIAAHFEARLTLLAVTDPLLAEADQIEGPARLAEETTRELERFFRQTFAERPHGIADVAIEVTSGKSAAEILRVSREQGCDLIVMSSHGATGFRKLFFGSTTERVLRETTAPGAGDVRQRSGTRAARGCAPADPPRPGPGRPDRRQLRISSTSLGLWRKRSPSHCCCSTCVEPVRAISTAHLRLAKIDAERRYRAERELEDAVERMPPSLKPEALIVYGEPAEEIAKVAADRDAGLIVMGLHSSPVLGPRMGSVTYRVLCLAHRLVLAVPPVPAGVANPRKPSSKIHRPRRASAARRRETVRHCPRVGMFKSVQARSAAGARVSPCRRLFVVLLR